MRALLIQKDVKPILQVLFRWVSLRALLIQKDVKRISLSRNDTLCLRALLIQKDVKPFNNYQISLWFESFVDLKSYKTKYIIMQIP